MALFHAKFACISAISNPIFRWDSCKGSVGTRFIANRNRVGFARKKARTISFVERGFERLGPGHQAVGFFGCSGIVELSSPPESFS